MAAHAYWRLLLRPAFTNSRADAKEVEFRGAVGGPSLTVGGTVLSSGSQGGLPGANAFDGLTTTEWSSNNAGQFVWIGYQFATAVDIVEVVYREGSNPNSCAPDGYLQHSDNGVDWTLLAPYLRMAATGGGVNTFTGFADLGPTRTRSAGARTTLGFPTGLPGARSAGAVRRYDPLDGGPLRVAGDVGVKAEDGGTGALVPGVDGNQIQPLRRRVRLLQRLTARLVREAWSNAATGAYEFTGLKDQDYLVIVDDYARVYNAVAADAVRPTP